MTTLVMAGQLLLGLGLLVFIHELGHFLAARAFGVKVEKFYIFFDFNGVKLFSKKFGDTEYGIGWFPLGGYVKIAGMIDESMDLDQFEKEPEDWELRSKPPWQRLIVMLAGVFMNIVLGIIIFTGSLLYFHKDYIDPKLVEDGVYAYPIGNEVGLETGDRIIAINGTEIERSQDLVSMRVFFGAILTVVRGEDTIKVDLPDEFFKKLQKSKSYFISLENHPFYVDTVLTENPDGTPTLAGQMELQSGDQIVEINGDAVKVFGDLRKLLIQNIGQPLQVVIDREGERVITTTDTLKSPSLGVGIGPKNVYKHAEKTYSFADALRFGTKDGFEAIYYNAVGMAKIFTGKVDAGDSVQSPLGIARIYGPVWQWSRFWYITGLISFILAFMNLLPIPALDGGHVVFIIVEMIQGKPVSQTFMENAQRVGIVLLLGIMLFAIGNDLYKIIFE